MQWLLIDMANDGTPPWRRRQRRLSGTIPSMHRSFSWEQLRERNANGLTIGSHRILHSDLSIFITQVIL
jgi:hypothetical protein